MKAYPSYIDSGVEWLTEIPSGWNYSSLKYLLRRKVSDGPHESPLFTDSGFPFLSVDGIQDGKLVFENCRYISEEDHYRFQIKCPVEKNDILMGKAASIGKIARVKVSFDFSVWSPLAIIKPHLEKLHPAFLEYSLKSIYSQDQIEVYATSNTQKNISMDDIQRIQVAYPPLPEQQAIADFLDRKTAQIDTLIEKKQRQIDLLQEQRTALINHAVTKGLNPDVRMKDSGVEWLGEIPSHWIVSKLKYVCYVSDGNHGEEYPEENDFTDEANGVPFIRVTEFEGFNITHNGILYITKEKNESMRKGGLQENDILFVNRGSIGKMALVSKEFEGANLNSQIAYFRVTSPKMNYKYLLYFLYSGTFQKMISSLIHGGALQQLPLKRIIGLEVLCPPLEDQIEIVNYLEKITTKADLSIKSISKEIELVQEYRTALISEAVTGKIDVRTAV